MSIDNEKSWSLREDARRRRRQDHSILSNSSQPAGKPDLSLSGSDPVPLSKIGTRLLASLASKGKMGTLACLRNAGSYFAESYCTGKGETGGINLHV